MPSEPPSPWNHTAHYHKVLLQSVPKPCSRALDVGCGEGGFARQLSAWVGHVDAIDEASEVLTRARVLSKEHRNLRLIDADFMSYPFASSSYDFISALATLHHLPFASALEKIKQLLRPGGILGVVGLYRIHSPIDYVFSAIAMPASRFHRLIRGLARVNAPIRAPEMTLGEIRKEMSLLLPGAILRRHLLWRYSIVWKKPMVEEESL